MIKLKLTLLLATLVSQIALAAGGSDFRLEAARNDITDIESLRAGAQFYVNNCQSCHSMEYMRYSRIGQDLQWSEDELRAQLNMSGSIYDSIKSPLDPEQGELAYGIAPPDLSLRARVRGSDWILTFLKGFYPDPDSPTGYNNVVYGGVAMPWLLAGMQGSQQPVYKEMHGEDTLIGLELTSAGSMNRKEFHDTMLDLTNFLEYAGEPAKMQRVQLGWKVMAFILVLIALTVLVKQEYWRDIRKT